jgi:hypothetical protein
MSGITPDDGEIQEMPEKTEPMNNSDRLLKHLIEGSLAYRLVETHRDRDSTDPVKSIKAILQERLEQARRNIEHPKD